MVITSVGRKSGALRKNPLMRVERGGKYLAVASIGGGPTNPEWYHNFLANPVVELQDGPEPKLYRARLLEGAEREDWWAHAVQTWGDVRRGTRRRPSARSRSSCSKRSDRPVRRLVPTKSGRNVGDLGSAP